MHFYPGKPIHFYSGVDNASGALLPYLVSVAKPYFAAQDRDFPGETGAVLAD